VKPVLITFSGIDGSGKSTQIQKLREYLLSEGIPVRELTFWDNVAVFRNVRSGFSRHVLQSDGRVGWADRPAARRDKNLQSWPLLIGRSALHLLDVVNLRRVVLRQRNHSGVVIFDRYIYDQLAALPMNRWWVHAFARLLLRIAPTPDISFLLDAIPEVARARKPEYPLEFMHKYRSSYLELCDLAGMKLIPASSPEDVHNAIVERFITASSAACAEAHVGSEVIAS
jgi:thymidylate kinase